MKNKSAAIQKIKELEEELRNLRLSLEQEEDFEEVADEGLQVGDNVRILNPNRAKFQEAFGTIIKLNRETDRVTVEGKRTKRKITRASKNVVKVD